VKTISDYIINIECLYLPFFPPMCTVRHLDKDTRLAI